MNKVSKKREREKEKKRKREKEKKRKREKKREKRDKETKRKEKRERRFRELWKKKKNSLGHFSICGCWGHRASSRFQLKENKGRPSQWLPPYMERNFWLLSLFTRTYSCSLCCLRCFFNRVHWPVYPSVWEYSTWVRLDNLNGENKKETKHFSLPLFLFFFFRYRHVMLQNEKGDPLNASLFIHVATFIGGRSVMWQASQLHPDVPLKELTADTSKRMVYNLLHFFRLVLLLLFLFSPQLSLQFEYSSRFWRSEKLGFPSLTNISSLSFQEWKEQFR